MNRSSDKTTSWNNFFEFSSIDWSSSQASSSNESTWLDLQAKNLDLSLNLSQAQVLDTLENLSLSQVSSRDVKAWLELDSNFKFRCRTWFDSSKASASWRITLSRDISNSYRCSLSELSSFSFFIISFKSIVKFEVLSHIKRYYRIVFFIFHSYSKIFYCLISEIHLFFF